MATPLDPDNTLNSSELALAARKNAVREFHVDQTGPGTWCVRVRLNWRDEDLHLVTRRDRTQPRCFKNITRLLQFIEKRFPKVLDIQLHLLPKLNQ